MGEAFDDAGEAALVTKNKEQSRLGHVQLAGTFLKRVLEATPQEGHRQFRVDGSLVEVGRLALGGDHEIYMVKHTHNKTESLLGQEASDYAQEDTYYFIEPDAIKVCDDDLSHDEMLMEAGEYEELREWRAEKVRFFVQHALAATEHEATVLNRLMHHIIDAVAA